MVFIIAFCFKKIVVHADLQEMSPHCIVDHPNV